MAYDVIADVVTVYIVIDCAVIASTGTAYTGMAYVVMVDIAIDYADMADIGSA